MQSPQLSKLFYLVLFLYFINLRADIWVNYNCNCNSVVFSYSYSQCNCDWL